MSVWGISVVRDEADVIGSTLGRMRGEFDYVAVADHGSVDGTRELLEDLADEVMDATDEDYQAPALNKLVDKAIDGGATWVVAFDADERWYSPWGRVADVLMGMPEAIAFALWYDHVPTAEDGTSGDPVVDMPWRQRVANGMPKLAARVRVPARFGEGYHQVEYPAPWAVALEVRHFPYRSPEQIERKVRNGLQARNRVLASVPHLVALGREIEKHGTDGAFQNLKRRRGAIDLIEDPCP